MKLHYVISVLGMAGCMFLLASLLGCKPAPAPAPKPVPKKVSACQCCPECTCSTCGAGLSKGK